MSDREDTFRRQVLSSMSVDPIARVKQWITLFEYNHFIEISEVEEDFNKCREIAIPLLIEGSKSSNGKIRELATYYLMRLASPEARQVFKERIQGDWGAIMRNAAEGLFRIGDKEEAINYLVGRILDKDADKEMRIGSAELLIRLGVKKVIPSDVSLDLENVSPYLHEKLRELYQALLKD